MVRANEPTKAERLSSTGDVARARRGDRAAFDRLVAAHAPAVCAIAAAVLGGAADSLGEEVAQETFVCAWRQLGTLEDPDRFGAWVRGIARLRALDALRHRLGRREVADAAVLGAVPDPAPDPGERLDADQREAALWRALDALDPDDREVLVLYYREGRAIREVARLLELPEPTARKRLSRARDRLRDGVEDRLHVHLERRRPRAATVALGVTALIASLAPSDAAAAAVRPSAWPSLAAKLGIGAGATGLAVALTLATGVVWLDRGLPDIDASPRAQAHPAIHAAAAPAEPAEPDSATAEPSLPPERVVHAFLAAEDARYLDHGALDLPAMARAAWIDASRGAPVHGGSTITQQLAKRMLADAMPDRSVRRKASEVLLALTLERRLTKTEILARYLDGVYLGAGVTGVDAAARLYFDASPDALTLAEAALLAGIPANPDGYGPYTDPDGARARRSYVLSRMAANGWASPSEVAEAEAAPLPGPR